MLADVRITRYYVRYMRIKASADGTASLKRFRILRGLKVRPPRLSRAVATGGAPNTWTKCRTAAQVSRTLGRSFSPAAQQPHCDDLLKFSTGSALLLQVVFYR
jgi:hypothetical protein